MDDGDSCLLQFLDNGSGTITCSLDNGDTLLDYGASECRIVGRIEGREKCEVDAEWLVRQRPRLSDLLTESLWIWLRESVDDSESASIAHGCCEFSIRNPLEASLHPEFWSVGLPAFGAFSGGFKLPPGLNMTYTGILMPSLRVRGVSNDMVVYGRGTLMDR